MFMSCGPAWDVALTDSHVEEQDWGMYENISALLHAQKASRMLACLESCALLLHANLPELHPPVFVQ